MAATIFKQKVKLIGGYLTGPSTIITTEDGKEFELTSMYGATGPETVIKPYVTESMSLEEVAEIVEGCFKKESNFFEVLEENVRKIKEFKITVEYDGIKVLVISQNANKKQIIENWKRKKELIERGVYYLIAVRKLAPIGKYDGKCLVLSNSEEDAILKVKKGYNYCECTCLGEYNVKDNTLLIKKANHYLGEAIVTVED